MSRAGISTGLVVALLGAALTAGPAGAGAAGAGPATTHHGPARLRPQAHSAKPVVARLSPATGPVAGGTEVTVKGRNFTPASKVFFGTARASGVRVKSSRKLVVAAPPHAAGEVAVRVQTKLGRSAESKASSFVYVVTPPVLTRLTPTAGPTSGGTPITLSGTGLAGATAVRFGNAKATAVRVVSATTVTAVTPARVSGPVDVTVITAGGSAVLPDAFTYAAAPTLSSVSPDSGPVNGATVSLVGTGLTAEAVVSFGGSPATDVRAAPDGTSLTATTPDHVPGWVTVSVTTTGGSASLTNGYLFVGGTTLSGVSPSAGPASGGQTVTLTGSGFTGETLVVFGTMPSLSVSANQAGTSLTAQLPPHVAGAVDVSVSTRGDSAVLPEAFTYVDAPTLSGVTPAAGRLSGDTQLTLTGTGFRAGMSVLVGGMPATEVTVNQAGTQLTALTPAHAAGIVDVVVTTVGGSAGLANRYEYLVAPTLTSFSPFTGPVAGGTSVSLTGAGFRAGMQVTFGGVAATGVTVTSATHATVTTPAHGVGDVTLSVSTPGGVFSAPGAFDYYAVPMLTSISPGAGPLEGGTTVTLTGSGLRGDMQVSFGGVAGTIVAFTSPTQLSVTTPGHAAGVVDVSVSNPGGSATLSGGFAYLAAPTLGSVGPVAGTTAGGTTVTLSGSGFRTGIVVGFDGTPGNVVSVSPGGTQLTVLTPPHAAGPVSVSVSTPGGADVLSDAFTYVAAPTLTDVTPSAGAVAGGATVVLSGSGFRPGMQVLFGSTSATGVAVNPDGTELTVPAPPHPAGAVTVTVTTPGGSASLAAGYVYVAAPELTGVSPDAGPLAGGATVTLTGSGFRPGTQVRFGTAAATGVAVSPDGTQLTALAPAHSAGTVDVSVTTPGGSATLGNSFTYLAPPTLIASSPGQGPATGGTTLTLTGSGFRAGMLVELGGTPAAIVSVNPAGTQLTATAPPHAAGDVDISVTTPGGTANLVGAFTYVAAPTVTDVSPATGPTSGGTSVTVTGTALTGTAAVTFDGVPATDVVVLDDQTVTATTPAHAEGAVDVEVVTAGGSAMVTGGFTYGP